MRVITVNADASYNYGKGGYAFWVRGDGPNIIQGSSPWPCGGIDEAEFVALASGFFAAIDNLPHQPGTAIILQSDSLNALGKLAGYGIGQGAKTSDNPIFPRKNRNPVIQAMAMRMWQEVCRTDVKVWLKHVKGHTGIANGRSKVNEWCDRQAKLARLKCA